MPSQETAEEIAAQRLAELEPALRETCKAPWREIDCTGAGQPIEKAGGDPFCSVCGRYVRPTSKGNARPHRRSWKPRQEDCRCSGLGYVPKSDLEMCDWLLEQRVVDQVEWDREWYAYSGKETCIGGMSCRCADHSAAPDWKTAVLQAGVKALEGRESVQ